MATTRKQYSAKFKARVAVEVIRGEKTLNQLGPQFGVHPVQIAHWRRTHSIISRSFSWTGELGKAQTQQPTPTETRCSKRSAG